MKELLQLGFIMVVAFFMVAGIFCVVKKVEPFLTRDKIAEPPKHYGKIEKIDTTVKCTVVGTLQSGSEIEGVALLFPDGAIRIVAATECEHGILIKTQEE